MRLRPAIKSGMDLYPATRIGFARYKTLIIIGERLER
jgi:hypothetical protein